MPEQPRYDISVVAVGDGWCVGFNGARYAMRTGLTEAIESAARLAAGLGVLEIAVHEADGTVRETLDVIQRPKA